ncbi:MAG: DUF5317 domain-containing protein [Chloroflexi bacterium]|nr:DUF5317 domain-containing protein [Chloroflexota bacterium]
MLISSVIIGLVLALLRRGDLRALAAVRFRWWWLIVLAFGLKFLLVRSAGSSPWLLTYGPALHAALYLLLLVPLLANRVLPGLRLVTAGVALNGLVILANGGRMPVSESALAALGKTATIDALARGQSVVHTLAADQTVLGLLGDWITLPPPWAAVASPGDFLLAAGVIRLITAVAGTSRSTRSLPTLRA